MSGCIRSSINPQYWLGVANERAPQAENASPWQVGTTAPTKPGYYERHFTDGTYTHYWDGSQWWAEKYTSAKALKAPIKPHWRQVGDYPCWKILAPVAQEAAHA